MQNYGFFLYSRCERGSFTALFSFMVTAERREQHALPAHPVGGNGVALMNSFFDNVARQLWNVGRQNTAFLSINLWGGSQ